MVELRKKISDKKLKIEVKMKYLHTMVRVKNIEGVSRTIPLAIFQSIQTGDDQNLSILILDRKSVV